MAEGAVRPLHVAAGGPEGAAHRLLLLHAMGADHRMWDPVRARLEARYRCLAPDQRGVGRSPLAQAAIPVEDHADDMAAVVRARGEGPVVAVGCAVGAAIATALAARHPETVRGLVLVNPLHRTRPEARAMLARRAADVRAGGMAAIMPEAVTAAFEGCPRDADFQEYCRRFVAQNPVAYAWQLEAILDCDTGPWLAAVACRTLVLAGGRDRLLPLHHAEALQRGIPLARLATIPEGAHFMPWQRPGDVAEAIADFIDTI